MKRKDVSTHTRAPACDGVRPAPTLPCGCYLHLQTTVTKSAKRQCGRRCATYGKTLQQDTAVRHYAFLKLFHYCLSVAPSIIRFHKDQGSQKTVRDNGETKSWRGYFCVRSGTHELRLSALLHPEETKAWSEMKRCEHTHTCSSL